MHLHQRQHRQNLLQTPTTMTSKTSYHPFQAPPPPHPMWARRPTGQTAKHSRVSGYLPHRIFFARHRSHITDSLITSACCSGVSSSFEILSLAFSRLSTGSYLLSVSHNCTSQMASTSAQAAQGALGCICRLECERRFHAPEVKIAPAKATVSESATQKINQNNRTKWHASGTVLTNQTQRP